MLRDEELADNPDCLYDAVMNILSDTDIRHSLKIHIAAYAKPRAAEDVAELIVKVKR
jgi:UDP-N-acetylglucosamine:LPS N-acetylglucosamine transferase